MAVQRAARSVISIILTVAAVALVVVAIVRPRSLVSAETQGTLVLVDRSDSVPSEALRSALADVAGRLESTGIRSIRIISFAKTRTNAIVAPVAQLARAPDRPFHAESDGTDLAATLGGAIAESDARTSGIVIVSDGWSTRDDPSIALHRAREAGIPIVWAPAASPPAPISIGEVRTAGSAYAGQDARLTIALRAREPVSATVVATLVNTGIRDHATVDLKSAPAVAGLTLVPPRAGRFVVDVEVFDARSGTLLARRASAALLEVAGPPTVLYVGPAGAPLAESLEAGGWHVEMAPIASLDARAAVLDAYQVIVLDDVAVWDASETFWRGLDAAVRISGAGLIVLGGDDSFGAGAYRNSLLERLLPVITEPPAMQSAARIMFAIDASGSMASASSGSARLDLARRAVLATIATLGAGDRAGVLTFDVEPHMLSDPEPAQVVRGAIDRSWSIAAQGGTLLAPALDAAIDALAGDDEPGRRLLILLSDGFIGNEPLERQRARLAAADVELIAVAIGPEANVDALSPLAQSSGGRVLRVAEISELPALLPAKIEALRSRAITGRIAVRQVTSPPFLNSLEENGWPPVSGYDVVRAAPQARLYLESARGDPLLVAGDAGAGKVIALPAGLGAWATDWIQWSNWPRFAGGLLDFASAGFDAGRPVIDAEELDRGFRVNVDVARGARWSEGPAPHLEIDVPDGRKLTPTLLASGPGRWSVTVNGTVPGIYAFRATSDSGAASTARAGQWPGERDFAGLNPQVEEWRGEGLVMDWSHFASTLRDRRKDAVRPPPILLVAALLLLCTGWLIERLPDRARSL